MSGILWYIFRCLFCLSVCLCACGCVHACVHPCVRACMHACVCVCLRVCITCSGITAFHFLPTFPSWKPESVFHPVHCPTLCSPINGFQANHSFSFGGVLPHGVCTVLYHPQHNMLIVGTPVTLLMDNKQGTVHLCVVLLQVLHGCRRVFEMRK